MKKLMLVFAMILTLGLVTVQAKVWRVNNTVGIQADFTTIAAAVSAAADGDTIYVEGSSSQYSGATIAKKIILIGTGFFLMDQANAKTQWNQNDASVGTLSFNAGSAGSVCSGLDLISYNYLNEQKITLERCHIEQVIFGYGNNLNINCDNDTVRQCYIDGAIVCQASGGTLSAKNEMIYNNIIKGAITFTNRLADITCFFINNDFVSSSTTYTSENCVFQNNIFYAPFFRAYGSSNYFANNIITNTSDASSIAATNNNKFSVPWNSLFVVATPNTTSPPAGSSHDGQFQLASSSAGIGAGSINGATVDCGVFGGSAPYILSGMPNLPSIYSLSVPQQVNNGTTTINISLSSAAH